MRTLKLAHNPLSSLVLSIATLLLVVSPAMRLFVPALGMTEVLLFRFPNRVMRPNRIVPARQDPTTSQIELSLLGGGDL